MSPSYELVLLISIYILQTNFLPQLIIEQTKIVPKILEERMVLKSFQEIIKIRLIM